MEGPPQGYHPEGGKFGHIKGFKSLLGTLGCARDVIFPGLEEEQELPPSP